MNYFIQARSRKDCDGDNSCYFIKASIRTYSSLTATPAGEVHATRSFREELNHYTTNHSNFLFLLKIEVLGVSE